MLYVGGAGAGRQAELDQQDRGPERDVRPPSSSSVRHGFLTVYQNKWFSCYSKYVRWLIIVLSISSKSSSVHDGLLTVLQNKRFHGY